MPRRRKRSDEDAIERWVRKLNRQGRLLDEIAASIHPNAWPEQLAHDMERWRKIARSAP